MNNLFQTLVLNDRIMLTNNFENIDLMLKLALKQKVGNKCLKDGFVLGNSINIIKRSLGKINTSFFDGSCSYDIKYTAKICNPKEGAIINVEYVDHNKMGILAEKKGTPLNIVIPKQLHNDKKLFQIIEEKNLNNEQIRLKIQVIGKRFEKFDKEIFVIGKLIDIL